MIKIENIEIGRHCPPFVIAEMSGNHNQSLERALEIVEAAARTGAHALKIQTYTPDVGMGVDIELRLTVFLEFLSPLVEWLAACLT